MSSLFTFISVDFTILSVKETKLVVDFSNIFVIIFIVGTVFSLVLNFWLEHIDFAFRKIHGREVPSELSESISEETLIKTCAYEDARYKLWIPRTIVTTVVSVVLLFCGFYPALFNSFWNMTAGAAGKIAQYAYLLAPNGNIYWTLLLFAVCASIPSAIIDLPFTLFSEFSVEKHFGFSKMTVKLWILDWLKSLFLTIIIGVPLLLLVVFAFEKTGKFWWLWVACGYTLLSLLISIVYPMFIAPLFNKFTPLEDGELKTRLTTMLQKCGFKANGLFVMDASKRSKHSNAYFTGFGKSKRVVLYDTLIEQMNVDEIEAVLGHELGHYKLHHITKRLCIMIPLVFVVLYSMSLLITNQNLYNGFGFATPKMVFSHMQLIGLFLLGEVFSGYSAIPALFSNWSSRKDEFAADTYSAKLCNSGKPLSSALIKLHKENLSEITVPEVYSRFKYNHPPLMERIRNIKV
jgi:STE24 endopeptidase